MTTMERLNNITNEFNKCTSIAGTLEKFYFVADSVKKYKVEQKEKKKINYNLTSKESVKEKSEEKKSSESKITLQNRMECPVHVMTREEKDAKKKSKNIELSKDGEHMLDHLVHHLYENKVVFTQPKKTKTGLYETSITQVNGNVVPVSIDNNGLLYSDEIKFFIGQMKPGDEYEPTRPCFYMTKESLEALKNGQMIPEKYRVPQEMFILNKLVDLTTLKEKDQQKRADTFKNVSKIFTDKETFDAVRKNANGEPYRFAFCRYTSPSDFSLASSKRNRLSNLSDEKQKVTKEQWINFKHNKVDLKVKNRTK